MIDDDTKPPPAATPPAATPPAATPPAATPIVPPEDLAPEVGGQKGPEPTRYGDWEKAGRCTDF